MFRIFSKIILSGIYIFLLTFLLQKNLFLMLKHKNENSNFRPKFACYFVIKVIIHNLVAGPDVRQRKHINPHQVESKPIEEGVFRITLRRNSKQILAEFLFIFVQKINKNPKIRIEIIYLFFRFFEKLFYCGFLFF